MKRIPILVGIMVFVIAGAVSCDKTATDASPLASRRGDEGMTRYALLVAPGMDVSDGSLTKAAVDTTILPEDYTIYLSSYREDPLNPHATGNYFTGIPYTYRGPGEEPDTRIWGGTPPQYWPFGGKMQFLGVASDLDLSEGLTWATDHNTDGVLVRVPSDNDGTHEVLYGSAGPTDGSITCVPMAFRHSQAYLVFNFSSKCSGLVRLRDITVEDAYTGGDLHVEAYPLPLVKWDTEEIDLRDVAVPDVIDGTSLDSGLELSYSLLIVPKTGRHFTIRFQQRASLDFDWKTRSVDVPFTFSETSQKWKAGVKYIYNFVIDPKEITFSAETEDMDRGAGDIVVVE